MTKFFRGCMQQCQHEKSQFCIVPAPPTNLTKHARIACSVKHEGAMRAHAGNWMMNAKIFSALHVECSTQRASMCCLRQPAIPVPGQLQYPGYATVQILNWNYGLSLFSQGCTIPRTTPQISLAGEQKFTKSIYPQKNSQSEFTVTWAVVHNSCQCNFFCVKATRNIIIAANHHP